MPYIRLLKDIHENEDAITAYEALVKVVGEKEAVWISPRPAPGKVRIQPIRGTDRKRVPTPQVKGLVISASNHSAAKWIKKGWAEACEGPATVPAAKVSASEVPVEAT